MSKVNFFSNSLIVLAGKECETTSSLSNTRVKKEKRFKVPLHTIDTNNLMIFLDGKLQVKDRDYTDATSTEIEFTNEINVAVDFQSILIATHEDNSTKDCKIRLDENEF